MVRPTDEQHRPAAEPPDSFSDLDSIETPARELVEALARPTGGIEVGVAPARIGRFAVAHRLGSGGMGVVYAGHDPELDRPVAIKLVRGAWLRGPEAAARLRREAQALARLSHPNVIVVYEVGEHVDPADPLGTQVFIAMELVQGQTLYEWLHAGDRSQRAVLDALLQTGRGLAAAHDAGLVHRDVKPTNVMIGGDGRVRLMDFGLARSDDASSGGDGDGSSQRSTDRSSLAGTPEYMAPEQRRGLAIGPRADQYAFCMMAWEALGGARPPETKTRIPARMRRALARGLAEDPDDRWPDMHALLAVLGRDRSRLWLAGGAIALIATTTTIAILRGPASADCDAETMASSLWDDDARARVQAAIVATDVPYAEATWTRVQSELDGWVERWSAVRAQACAGGAGLPEALRTTQVRCLAHREQAFTALTGVLQEVDRASVEKIAAATVGLPRVEPCTDEAWLAARVPPPEDPELARGVEEIRERLSRARALDDAGRYADGVELAQQSVDAARSIDYPPVLAEALVHLGRLAEGAGRYAEAEAALREAHALGIASGDDAVAAEAAIRMVYVVGYRLARPKDGLEWAYLAEPELRRAGPDAPSEAALSHNLGAVHELKGDHAEALSHYQRALALRESTLAADDPKIAGTIDGMAAVHWMLADYDAALAGYRRSLALRESLLGPDHPGIASSLQGLADVSFLRGEYDQALAYYERARDVLERALGPEHPRLAALLGNMGALYNQRGEYDLALAQHTRALAIRRKNLRPDHPEIAGSLENIGNVHYQRAQYDEALALHREALAIREKSSGPDHLDVALSLVNIGHVHADLGRYDEALAEYARALAIREKAFGPDHPKVMGTLQSIGRAQRGMGRLADARATFERVLATRERTLPAGHSDIADTAHMLGVIATDQGEYDRALEHLRRSLEIREAAYGPDDSSVAVSLFGIAEALLRRGDATDALPLAERGLAIRQRPDQRPLDLADAQTLVAKVLVASGGDRERAFALADAAAAAYRERPDAAAVLAELERWRNGAEKRRAPARAR